MRMVAGLVVLLLAAMTASAVPPEYAVRQDDAKFPGFLDALKERVPPLKHPRGTRWPMILWESVAVDKVQEPEVYRALLDRGLTAHIRMDEKFLPMALALQGAGAPVIMMNGGGGAWPAQLAGDHRVWQHQFEDGYTFAPGTSWWDNYVRPCLGLHEGWAVQGDNVRSLLLKFKAAGVTVDAVWMDWEGDPYACGYQFEQAAHCVRCREMLPAWVLASPENCMAYCWRLYLRLLDTFLAAPVADVFPRASTTNWMVVFSSRERPVRHWNGRVLPPSGPTMMRATNPVAYGNTVFWKYWEKGWPLDQEHVDQFYTHLLLQQISADAANMAVMAPEKECIPWVSRWCPDDENPEIPVLSRERYREILRHMWLRGADGMQLFNAAWGRKGHVERMFTEVEDAVAVYDEMLAYADLLEEGAVMCTECPPTQDEGVLWSGLRTGRRAVVRVIKQGEGTAELTLEVWPGDTVKLAADGAGMTYLMERNSGVVNVTAVAAGGG